MNPGRITPCLVEPRLEEALEDSPVVLIHGPRQSGKTTLAQRVGAKRRYAYFNLNDDVVRATAAADPMGFVSDFPQRSILDEVQRVPSLFTALKVSVDRDSVAGRFLLTGSASVFLVPKLADSLAGRMEIIRLFPFAQCEMATLLRPGCPLALRRSPDAAELAAGSLRAQPPWQRPAIGGFHRITRVRAVTPR